ncbi:MAG: hypothetical protein MR808_11350 [Alistipes sp.]|nr:hypothetical protein [Alistipes sp.]
MASSILWADDPASHLRRRRSREMEAFVEKIISQFFPEKIEGIYFGSPLIQYLDKKSGAIHGGSKTRRSLANYYAIYSLVCLYIEDFYEKPEAYSSFSGYEFSRLLCNFYFRESSSFSGL